MLGTYLQQFNKKHEVNLRIKDNQEKKKKEIKKKRIKFALPIQIKK